MKKFRRIFKRSVYFASCVLVAGQLSSASVFATDGSSEPSEDVTQEQTTVREAPAHDEVESPATGTVMRETHKPQTVAESEPVTAIETTTPAADTLPPAVSIDTVNGVALVNPSFVDDTFTIAGTATDDLSDNDSGINSVGPLVFTDSTTGQSVSFTNGSGFEYDDSSDTWSATLSNTDLPDGTYTVSMTATDDAGNVGAATFASLVIDNQSPQVKIDSPFEGEPVGGIRRIEASITDSSLKEVRVIVKDGNGDAVFDTGWQPTPSTLLDKQIVAMWDTRGEPEALYTIAVRARDHTGNIGDDDVIVPVDHTVPSGSLNLPLSSSSTPFLTGTVDDETAYIDLFINGARYRAENGKDGTWRLRPGAFESPVAPGLHDIVLVVTDPAGNIFSQTYLKALLSPEPASVTPAATKPAASSTVVQRDYGEVEGVSGSIGEEGSSVESSQLPPEADGAEEITAKASNTPWWWWLVGAGIVGVLWYILWRRGESGERS